MLNHTRALLIAALLFSGLANAAPPALNLAQGYLLPFQLSPNGQVFDIPVGQEADGTFRYLQTTNGVLQTTVSGTGAGNAAAGLTGATPPASADYIGTLVNGNLTGVSAANPLPISPIRASSTHANGTIATANTFQTALAASPTRLGCLITNTGTVTLSLDLGASPALSTSIPITIGSFFNCATAAGLVINDQINLTAATTSGSAYVVYAQ